jgi:dTDP-4-dehydrorhamnose 3,5-epimerase
MPLKGIRSCCMEIKPLSIPGVFEITLAPRRDERGYFMRTFDEEIFRKHGLVSQWVQENEACSVQQGVVRGLHFQRPPATETKLVRVVAGRALDVFVDLRRDSPTFGRWGSIELAAERQNMVYVPKGFAHGYCTLSDHVVMLYKVDAPYSPQLEGGLRWNDPALRIAWPVTEPTISAKDAVLPLLKEFELPF